MKKKEPEMLSHRDVLVKDYKKATKESEKIRIVKSLYDSMGAEYNESTSQLTPRVRKLLNEKSNARVRRYLRLNDLIPEFMDLLDEKEISLTNAEEISRLSPNVQKVFFSWLEDHPDRITSATYVDNVRGLRRSYVGSDSFNYELIDSFFSGMTSNDDEDSGDDKIGDGQTPKSNRKYMGQVKDSSDHKPEEKEEEKPEPMSPAEYFAHIKNKKHEQTEEYLNDCYAAIEKLAARFKVTGQKKAIAKLQFLEECLDLEMPVVKAGYCHYVNRWDIEDYIENLSDPCVFIKEMENYEREFPDEVIDEIIRAKEVFGDNLYVLFTDYTKKEARKVAKERREKDPILFGALKKNVSDFGSPVILDRLYYICDWVDEHCDLTLDKLVGYYADKKKESPVRNVLRGDVPDAISDMMNRLTTTDTGEFVDPQRVSKDMLSLNSYEINSLNSVVKDIDLEESILNEVDDE